MIKTAIKSTCITSTCIPGFISCETQLCMCSVAFFRYIQVFHSDVGLEALSLSYMARKPCTDATEAYMRECDRAYIFVCLPLKKDFKI